MLLIKVVMNMIKMNLLRWKVRKEPNCKVVRLLMISIMKISKKMLICLMKISRS